MRVGASVAASAIVAALGATAGCSILPSLRGNERVGSYVDDATITSTVKARLAEDRTVALGGIDVETAHGNVVLTGAATSAVEKSTAESLAIKVRGVRSVRNDVVVRP